MREQLLRGLSWAFLAVLIALGVWSEVREPVGTAQHGVTRSAPAPERT